MRNPLRSEEEAFRFLLLTIGYFALIVIASVINTWLGLAVFILLTLFAGWWGFLRPRDEPIRPERVRPTAQDETSAHRILVIANETVGGDELCNLLKTKVGSNPAEVLIVAPALNSAIGQITGDGRAAHADAQARLDASVEKLRGTGIRQVRGEIGEGEPLQAIEDALRTFGANEIVISTHPEGRSHWLEQGLVEQARERFAVPITHVVVHGGDREEIRS